MPPSLAATPFTGSASSRRGALLAMSLSLALCVGRGRPLIVVPRPRFHRPGRGWTFRPSPTSLTSLTILSVSRVPRPPSNLFPLPPPMPPSRWLGLRRRIRMPRAGRPLSLAPRLQHLLLWRLLRLRAVLRPAHPPYHRTRPAFPSTPAARDPPGPKPRAPCPQGPRPRAPFPRPRRALWHPTGPQIPFSPPSPRRARPRALLAPQPPWAGSPVLVSPPPRALYAPEVLTLQPHHRQLAPLLPSLPRQSGALRPPRPPPFFHNPRWGVASLPLGRLRVRSPRPLRLMSRLPPRGPQLRWMPPRARRPLPSGPLSVP